MEGGVGIISQTSPDFKQVFSVFMAAIAMQKPVVVRYAAEGVNCVSTQTIEGVWLSR
jgi:hypothetical protein